MPDHLKTLAVILMLALGMFALARPLATAAATAPKDYDRRRNLWLALVLTAFLAHHFWLFILASGAILLFAQRAEPNKLALYFFVLFAVPAIDAEIPGMGIMQVLFRIEYGRLLALAVLLPAYLHLRKQPDVMPFGRCLPDKLIGAYLVLTLLLMVPNTPLTIVLRKGVFLPFIDFFLPYYVASRCLRNLEQFRDALTALVVAGLVLSATLVAEFGMRWLLYSSLDRALGMAWGWAQYVPRGDHLRASGPMGHPIVAGYAVAVAFGLYFYLRELSGSTLRWRLGLMLLAGGLIAPLSRGPWMGALVMVLAIVATGPAPALAVARLGLLALVAIPVLVATGGGEVILRYLPFVGTVAADSVAFRERLAQAAYQTFLENPILGKPDYLDSPAMEAMRGVDGLIDLVNAYVVVGLGSGLVGLSLFLGFFVVVATGIWRGLQTLPTKDDERHALGRTLLASLLGILVMIATLAPVLAIPIIYWAVAGLGVGYVQLLRLNTAAAIQSAVPGRRVAAYARS